MGGLVNLWIHLEDKPGIILLIVLGLLLVWGFFIYLEKK